MATDATSSSAACLEGQRLLRRAVNAPIRMALTHWLGLQDDGAIPTRDRLDPVELPSRLLPYLFLLECAPADQWRLRLLGSHIVEALGRDLTGCALVEEEIPGILQSRTFRLLGQMRETGLPGHFHGRSTFRFKEGYGDHEQVLLPFRQRGADRIDAALGAIVYEGLQSAFGPGATW